MARRWSCCNMARRIARRQGARADAVLIAEGLDLRGALLSHSGDGAEGPLSRRRRTALEPSAELERDVARGYARLAGSRGACAGCSRRAARRSPARRRRRALPPGGRYSPSPPRRCFEEALRRSSARRLAEAAAYSVERVVPELAARRALGGGAPSAFVLGNSSCWRPGLSPISTLSLSGSTLLALLFLANIVPASSMSARCAGGRERPRPRSEEAICRSTRSSSRSIDEAEVVPQLTGAIDGARLSARQARCEIRRRSDDPRDRRGAARGASAGLLRDHRRAAGRAAHQAARAQYGHALSARLAGRRLRRRGRARAGPIAQGRRDLRAERRQARLRAGEPLHP